jgi:hypothetical protein
MIKGKSDIVKWFIIMLCIGLLILMFGCNPVKQVLKSKERTAKVVREYIRENPPVNDTMFLPGEVIRLDTTIYDSVPVPYPVNHRYTETRVIKEHSRDTIKVIDRTFIDLLNTRLTNLEKEFLEMKADRDMWRSEARVRLYWLLGLILLIIGSGVFYVIKILQPKITLMK